MDKPKDTAVRLDPPAFRAALEAAQDDFLSNQHEDWLACFPRAAELLKMSRPLADTATQSSINPAVGDTLWAGRFFRVERWGTSEWQIGFGWWDGAVEVYLGPWIVRFQGHPAEYR